MHIVEAEIRRLKNFGVKELTKKEYITTLKTVSECYRNDDWCEMKRVGEDNELYEGVGKNGEYICGSVSDKAFYGIKGDTLVNVSKSGHVTAHKILSDKINF